MSITLFFSTVDDGDDDRGNWAAPGTVTVCERYIEVQSSTVTATGGTVSPR